MENDPAKKSVKSEFWKGARLLVSRPAISSIARILFRLKSLNKFFRDKGIESALRNNLYIKVLQYGDKHPTGFTITELTDALSLSTEDYKFVFAEFSSGNIFRDTGRKRSSTNEWILRLTFEDKFKLLEYQALQEARGDSSRAQKWTKKAFLIASVTLVVTTSGIGVSFYFQNQSKQSSDKSLEIARQAFELTAYPTVSIYSTSSDPYGTINYASSSISLILKNNSPTNLTDFSLRATLVQTYYDKEVKRLVIGPVAEFLNKKNQVFQSYGMSPSDQFSQKFNLSPLQEHSFNIYPPPISKDEGICITDQRESNVYKSKYKYFVRVDVQYTRKIDKQIFDYVKFYSLNGEKSLANDLEVWSVGLNWIISEENDSEEAIFIYPFKSEKVIRYLTTNKPPYGSLESEYFDYDPISDEIYYNPVRSLEGILCLKLVFPIR